MTFHLVVTQAFGAHEIGDHIDDAAEMDQAQAEHPACVVRVLSDPAPVVTAEAVLAARGDAKSDAAD